MHQDYYWYKLYNIKGVGNKTLHLVYNKLIDNGLSISELFQKDSTGLVNFFNNIKNNRIKIDTSNIYNLDDENDIINYNILRNNQIQIISLDNPKYPERLKQILKEESPAILFVKGYLNLLNSNSISIVGSRNIEDDNILEVVSGIAYILGQNGWNIVSGFAKGVDTKAHVGALEGGGTTSIVLSYGLNNLSIKKEFNNLDWKRNSLFISQFAPNEKFSGYNAMKRNKLVCSFSQAVIVISSGPEKDKEGKMSGTFDAGKTTLKYGLPLFVLSPDCFNTDVKGNEELIKMGGIEVKNEDDILAKLKEKIKDKDILMNQINFNNKNENAILNNRYYQTDLFD